MVIMVIKNPDGTVREEDRSIVDQIVGPVAATEERMSKQSWDGLVAANDALASQITDLQAAHDELIAKIETVIGAVGSIEDNQIKIARETEVEIDPMSTDWGNLKPVPIKPPVLKKLKKR
jgi:hypothetical protein